MEFHKSYNGRLGRAENSICVVLPISVMTTIGWEAYILQLKVADLTSVAACKAHLALFADNIVANGLVGTKLGQHNDCIRVIADFVSKDDSVPRATSLRMVTDEAQRINIMRVCAYLGEQATSAAVEGLDCTRVVVSQSQLIFERLLASLKTRRVEMADVLETIKSKMEDGFGFKMYFCWGRCKHTAAHWNCVQQKPLDGGCQSGQFPKTFVLNW